MGGFAKSLVLAAGAIGFAGAAMAADVVRPVVTRPVVVAPAYNWTGHYIGAQAGWDRTHLDIEDGSFPGDADGGIAGVFAGWNIMHTGPWVFGIDGSANWSNAHADSCGGPCVLDTSVDFKGFIRGRAGVAVDRLLFYGTFGVVVAHIEDPDFPLGDNTRWGWTAGLGLDLALHRRHFIRLDWAYQDFGTFTSNDGGYSVAATANTFMIGLGWRL
jgi:outer membrane immunogenic protein